MGWFSFLFPKGQTSGPRHKPARADWIPDPSRNLTIYIGWPLEAPVEWRKVEKYNRERLELSDVTITRPGDVRSHLSVYQNNEVLTGSSLFLPLPSGLKFLESQPAPKEPLVLHSAQMDFGKAVCQVAHDRFRTDPSGQAIYTTTLRNISPQRIKIERFGGFRKAGSKYVLNNVSGNFYTAEQFIAWYAAPPSGWIDPGQQVADESNYGGRGGIWAYFGQTEDGNHFIAAQSI